MTNLTPMGRARNFYAWKSRSGGGKKKELFRVSFRLFGFRFQTPHWKFQCDVVVCEVVRFLVEPSGLLRCHPISFRWVVCEFSFPLKLPVQDII